MTSSAEGVSVGTLAFTSGVCANAYSAILAAEDEVASWAVFFLRQSLHKFYNRFNSKVASIVCSAVYPTLKILLTHHVPILSIKI